MVRKITYKGGEAETPEKSVIKFSMTGDVHDVITHANLAKIGLWRGDCSNCFNPFHQLASSPLYIVIQRPNVDKWEKKYLLTA